MLAGFRRHLVGKTSTAYTAYAVDMNIARREETRRHCELGLIESGVYRSAVRPRSSTLLSRYLARRAPANPVGGGWRHQPRLLTARRPPHGTESSD